MITINMAKAREVLRNHLRAERTPFLKEKDFEFMRAVEASDASLQRDIVEEKQKLRDLPQNPAIEEAKDLDELIACWPPELGPNPFLPRSSEAS